MSILHLQTQGKETRVTMNGKIRTKKVSHNRRTNLQFKIHEVVTKHPTLYLQTASHFYVFVAENQLNVKITKLITLLCLQHNI